MHSKDFNGAEPLRPGWQKSVIAWIILGLFAIFIFSVREQWSWTVKIPEVWIMPFADWINAFMNWFVATNKTAFRFLLNCFHIPWKHYASC